MRPHHFILTVSAFALTAALNAPSAMWNTLDPQQSTPTSTFNSNAYNTVTGSASRQLGYNPNATSLTYTPGAPSTSSSATGTITSSTSRTQSAERSRPHPNLSQAFSLAPPTSTGSSTQTIRGTSSRASSAAPTRPPEPQTRRQLTPAEEQAITSTVSRPRPTVSAAPPKPAMTTTTSAPGPLELYRQERIQSFQKQESDLLAKRRILNQTISKERSVLESLQKAAPTSENRESKREADRRLLAAATALADADTQLASVQNSLGIYTTPAPLLRPVAPPPTLPMPQQPLGVQPQPTLVVAPTISPTTSAVTTTVAPAAPPQQQVVAQPKPAAPKPRPVKAPVPAAASSSAAGGSSELQQARARFNELAAAADQIVLKRSTKQAYTQAELTKAKDSIAKLNAAITELTQKIAQSGTPREGESAENDTTDTGRLAKMEGLLARYQKTVENAEAFFRISREASAAHDKVQRLEAAQSQKAQEVRREVAQLSAAVQKTDTERRAANKELLSQKSLETAQREIKKTQEAITKLRAQAEAEKNAGELDSARVETPSAVRLEAAEKLLARWETSKKTAETYLANKAKLEAAQRELEMIEGGSSSEPVTTSMTAPVVAAPAPDTRAADEAAAREREREEVTRRQEEQRLKQEQERLQTIELQRAADLKKEQELQHAMEQQKETERQQALQQQVALAEAPKRVAFESALERGRPLSPRRSTTNPTEQDVEKARVALENARTNAAKKPHLNNAPLLESLQKHYDEIRTAYERSNPQASVSVTSTAPEQPVNRARAFSPTGDEEDTTWRDNALTELAEIQQSLTTAPELTPVRQGAPVPPVSQPPMSPEVAVRPDIPVARPPLLPPPIVGMSAAVQNVPPLPLIVQAPATGSSNAPTRARGPNRALWNPRNVGQIFESYPNERVYAELKSYIEGSQHNPEMTRAYAAIVNDRIAPLEMDSRANKGLRQNLRQVANELQALPQPPIEHFADSEDGQNAVVPVPVRVPTREDAIATMNRLNALNIPDYNAQRGAFRDDMGRKAFKESYEAINELARESRAYVDQLKTNLSTPEQTPEMTAAYYNALNRQFYNIRSNSSSVELPEDVNQSFQAIGYQVTKLKAKLDDMGIDPASFLAQSTLPVAPPLPVLPPVVSQPAASSSSAQASSAMYRTPWTVQNVRRRLEDSTAEQVYQHIDAYLRDPQRNPALAPFYAAAGHERAVSIEDEGLQGDISLRRNLRKAVDTLQAMPKPRVEDEEVSVNGQHVSVPVPVAAQEEPRALQARLKALDIPDYNAQSQAFRLGGGGMVSLSQANYEAIKQLAAESAAYNKSANLTLPGHSISMTAAFYNALQHQYNKFRSLSGGAEVPADANLAFQQVQRNLLTLKARLEDRDVHPCGNGDARQACEGLHEGEYPV